ncbi:MAG: hypothetical protein ACKVU2_11750 [Saprospiraceae bacterium]
MIKKTRPARCNAPLKLNEKSQIAFDGFLELSRHKRYHQAFWNLDKPVTAIGVNFSSKTKNIENGPAAEV